MQVRVRNVTKAMVMPAPEVIVPDSQIGDFAPLLCAQRLL